MPEPQASSLEPQASGEPSPDELKRRSHGRLVGDARQARERIVAALKLVGAEREIGRLRTALLDAQKSIDGVLDELHWTPMKPPPAAHGPEESGQGPDSATKN